MEHMQITFILIKVSELKFLPIVVRSSPLLWQLLLFQLYFHLSWSNTISLSLLTSFTQYHCSYELYTQVQFFVLPTISVFRHFWPLLISLTLDTILPKSCTLTYSLYTFATATASSFLIAPDMLWMSMVAFSRVTLIAEILISSSPICLAREALDTAYDLVNCPFCVLNESCWGWWYVFK